ncbi:acyltransferase domain-containing protein [Nocardia halotolerans]|uniref:Acyltransferase domain-containing protein n=1 Tax=Nocardia halotolerans TaxID=1755878 RepID=A0ABV8VDR7_9NOCA
MFPGQGSQYTRMAADLYRREPTFTCAMDEVFEAIGADGGRMCDDWRAEEPAVPIDHVTRAQPLLFAVDYALGRMVMNWGFRPDVLIGHSIGEMVAAVFAEIFSLQEAVGIVLDRVRRLADAPPGGMLAVAAAVDEVERYLSQLTAVAAVNAPKQTILAGPSAELDVIAAELRTAGKASRRVPSLTAFHSPVLAPAAAGSAAYLRSTNPRPPRIPVFSCYTTDPLDERTATDRDYWVRQPVDTVRFWPTLDKLMASYNDLICVEVGPGRGLSMLALRHPAVREGRVPVVAVSPARPGIGDGDWRTAAAAFASLSTLFQLPR